MDVDIYISGLSLSGIFFFYRNNEISVLKLIREYFKERKSTVGLIVLEPRALVESVSCLANCVGDHSRGVCDIGLC